MTPSMNFYIDGQWVAPLVGNITTTNPATGEKAGGVRAEATKWMLPSRPPGLRSRLAGPEPDKRAAILLKIADIIDENKELLATIESMDNGKPIRETMTIDVPYSSDHFRYFPAPSAPRRVPPAS